MLSRIQIQWPGKAGRRRYYIFAMCAYVGTLILILVIGAPPFWTWWDTLFLYPAIGVLVATISVMTVYNIFGILLPLLLDTLRSLVRVLLPQQYTAPLSAALTRWWGRMPAWMRDSVWMPDDEPFEPKSKRPPQ